MPVSRRRVAFRLRPVTIRQAWIGSTELETRPPAATQQRTALHSTNDQRPLEESPVTCSRHYPVLSKRSSVSIQQSAFDDYSSSGGFSLPRATALRSIPRRSILANNCLPAADSAASGIFEPDATLPAKRAAVATYGDAGSARPAAATTASCRRLPRPIARPASNAARAAAPPGRCARADLSAAAVTFSPRARPAAK